MADHESTSPKDQGVDGGIHDDGDEVDDEIDAISAEGLNPTTGLFDIDDIEAMTNLFEQSEAAFSPVLEERDASPPPGSTSTACTPPPSSPPPGEDLTRGAGAKHHRTSIFDKAFAALEAVDSPQQQPHDQVDGKLLRRRTTLESLSKHIPPEASSGSAVDIRRKASFASVASAASARKPSALTDAADENDESVLGTTVTMTEDGPPPTPSSQQQGTLRMRQRLHQLVQAYLSGWSSSSTLPPASVTSKRVRQIKDILANAVISGEFFAFPLADEEKHPKEVEGEEAAALQDVVIFKEHVGMAYAIFASIPKLRHLPSCDASASQGLDLLMHAAAAADVLPDQIHPSVTAALEAIILSDWKPPQSSALAMNFITSVSLLEALPFCEHVLNNCRQFQHRVVLTGLTCVAQAALDNMLENTIRWIAPALSVIKFLASTAIQEELLSFAVDLLSFALATEKSTAVFLELRGLVALAELINSMDVSSFQTPDVPRRVVQLLNPASLLAEVQSLEQLSAAAFDGVTSSSMLLAEEGSATCQSQQSFGRTSGNYNRTAAAANDVSPLPMPSSRIDGIDEASSHSSFSGASGINALASSGGGGKSRRVMEAEDYAVIGQCIVVVATKYRVAVSAAQGCDGETPPRWSPETPTFCAMPSVFPSDETPTSGSPSGGDRLRVSAVTAKQYEEVMSDCLLAAFALMQHSFDVCSSQGLLQDICRQIALSPSLWRCKPIMASLLAAISTYVALHSSTTHTAMKKHASASDILAGPARQLAATSGNAAKAALRNDSIIGDQQFADVPTAMTTAEAEKLIHRSSPGYYRCIMQNATLSVLSLALRCFCDDEIANSLHAATAYRVLYLVCVTEPARRYLLEGCGEFDADDIDDEADPAASVLSPSDTCPRRNSIIPCILDCLLHTKILEHQRYCFALLRKLCSGSSQACMQLVGPLPISVLAAATSGGTATTSTAAKLNHSSYRLADDLATSVGSSAIGVDKLQHGASSPGSFLRVLSKLLSSLPPTLLPAALSVAVVLTKALRPQDPQSARRSSSFRGSLKPGTSSNPSGLLPLIPRQFGEALLGAIQSTISTFNVDPSIVSMGIVAIAHLCRVCHMRQPSTVPPLDNSLFVNSGIVCMVTEASVEGAALGAKPAADSEATVSPQVSSAIPTYPYLKYGMSNNLLDVAFALTSGPYRAPAPSAAATQQQQVELTDEIPDAVKKALGYLFASFALDVAEGGGLDGLMDDPALVKEFVEAAAAKPNAPSQGFFTPNGHRRSVAASNSNESTPTTAAAAGAHGGLINAGIIGRDERDFCRRQLRIIERFEDAAEGGGSSRRSTTGGAFLDDNRDDRGVAGAASSAPTVPSQQQAVDMAAQKVTLALLDSLRTTQTHRRNEISVEEATSRDSLEHAFETSARDVKEHVHLRRQRQQTERAELEAVYIQLREQIQEFASERFFDIMRKSHRSLSKQITKQQKRSAASSIVAGGVLNNSGLVSDDATANSTDADGGTGGSESESASTLRFLSTSSQRERASSPLRAVAVRSSSVAAIPAAKPALLPQTIVDAFHQQQHDMSLQQSSALSAILEVMTRTQESLALLQRQQQQLQVALQLAPPSLLSDEALPHSNNEVRRRPATAASAARRGRSTQTGPAPSIPDAAASRPATAMSLRLVEPQDDHLIMPPHPPQQVGRFEGGMDSTPIRNATAHTPTPPSQSVAASRDLHDSRAPRSSTPSITFQGRYIHNAFHNSGEASPSAKASEAPAAGTLTSAAAPLSQSPSPGYTGVAIPRGLLVEPAIAALRESPQSITDLDFSRTYLGDRGLIAIVPLIAQAHQLRSISLRGNGISYSGLVPLLADALANKQLLKVVDLSKNAELTPRCGRDIVLFVRANPSVWCVRLSETSIFKSTLQLVESVLAQRQSESPSNVADAR